MENRERQERVENSRRKKYDRAKARELMKELRSYEQEGMQLCLNGSPCASKDIVDACMIEEEQNYMRDFISDDSKHIRRINFVKIREI